MWMDWIVYGGEFGPAFGTANHWIIDEVARTPPADRDLKITTFAHVRTYVPRSRPTRQPVPLGGGRRDGAEINRWSPIVHATAAAGYELTRPEFLCLKIYKRADGAALLRLRRVRERANHHGRPDEVSFISLAADGE